MVLTHIIILFSQQARGLPQSGRERACSPSGSCPTGRPCSMHLPPCVFSSKSVSWASACHLCYGYNHLTSRSWASVTLRQGRGMLCWHKARKCWKSSSEGERSIRDSEGRALLWLRLQDGGNPPRSSPTYILEVPMKLPEASAARDGRWGPDMSARCGRRRNSNESNSGVVRS